MSGTRRFLIYTRHGPHPIVCLASAAEPEQALRAYIRQQHPDATLEAGGAVWFRDGRSEYRFPHPLAYVEAVEKASHEWQLREVPEAAFGAELAEVFCGEDADNVEAHLLTCRALLRQEFPRSRAPGFVWYLRDGVLVTFYRRRALWRIEVLLRYLRRWAGSGEYVPWTGSYPDLLDDLYLGPQG